MVHEDHAKRRLFLAACNRVEQLLYHISSFAVFFEDLANCQSGKPS